MLCRRLPHCLGGPEARLLGQVTLLTQPPLALCNHKGSPVNYALPQTIGDLLGRLIDRSYARRAIRNAYAAAFCANMICTQFFLIYQRLYGLNMLATQILSDAATHSAATSTASASASSATFDVVCAWPISSNYGTGSRVSSSPTTPISGLWPIRRLTWGSRSFSMSLLPRVLLFAKRNGCGIRA